MKRTFGVLALLSILSIATYGGPIAAVKGTIQGDTAELEDSKVEDNGVYKNAGAGTSVNIKVGGGDAPITAPVQPTAGSLQFFNSQGFLFHTDDDDTRGSGEWDLVAMAVKTTEPTNLYLSAKNQGKENITSDATSVTFSTASNSFVTVKDGKDSSVYASYYRLYKLANTIKYEWSTSGNTLSLKATYTPYRLSNYGKVYSHP